VRPGANQQAWIDKHPWWIAKQTPREFRFEEHPYYAEWKYDFLMEGCQNQVVDCNKCLPDYRVEHMCPCRYFQLEIVRDWLKKNCRGQVYIVGERVSMMDDRDAVDFKLRWC
jgi:hypothetical protein